MLSIKDVAKLAGVSTCTVSRALANKKYVKPETRKRVIEAAETLNYKPNYLAKSLKVGSSYTIGLIVPDITNFYYPKIAKSIEEYVWHQGYMIILCNANMQAQKEKLLVGMLIERNVDGVVILPTTQDIEYIHRLIKNNVPYVILNREFKGLPNCIPSDNKYGGYTMACYLLEKGHRNICCLFPSFDNPIYFERYLGVLEAFEEYGVHNNLAFYDVNDMNQSHNIIKGVFECDQGPTAIFAANDMLCIGVYKAINEVGLSIPGDVSVVGYDNISIDDMMNPPLTTYEQPEDKMAKVAIDYLISIIKGKETQKPDKLRGNVIERKSVRIF